MNWIEVALVAALILGLVAGGVLVARSPTFWVGLGTALLKAAWPYVWKFISAPEPEDVRKARQLCERQGRRWNAAKRRCE